MISATDCQFGFRIVGNCQNERRLIDWAAAFLAHAACNDRAEPHCECYLSAFMLPDEFSRHLTETGSTKGYAGACGGAWLWFDIDADVEHGDTLERTQHGARRVAAFIADRYALDGDELLMFFSGAKGFHIGVPLSLCGSPGPSVTFHRVCRRLAEKLAAAVGVTIDTGIYDRVRAFRAPNSRHPKTGLHKRPLTFDEMLGLALPAVLKLATIPAPIDIPELPTSCERAVADWAEAVQAVEREAAAIAERRQYGNVSNQLNRLTLDFIRQGAAVGDRHRRLYSAARNLAEFGCPPALVHALLSESALDSGLPPKDVYRQIQCGLTDGKGVAS